MKWTQASGLLAILKMAEPLSRKEGCEATESHEGKRIWKRECPGSLLHPPTPSFCPGSSPWLFHSPAREVLQASCQSWMLPGILCPRHLPPVVIGHNTLCAALSTLHCNDYFFAHLICRLTLPSDWTLAEGRFFPPLVYFYFQCLVMV